MFPEQILLLRRENWGIKSRGEVQVKLLTYPHPDILLTPPKIPLIRDWLKESKPSYVDCKRGEGRKKRKVLLLVTRG